MEQWPFNVELNRAVAVKTGDIDWVASPSPGVERKPLERERAESGRTSSVVRYAPGSSFPHHVHDGGEEFLVLGGVFSDDYGDFPAGTYVRNPPLSEHAPFTENGCTIFVKLCQFQEGDQQRVVLDWNKNDWVWHSHQDMCSLLLHQYDEERVELKRLGAGVPIEWPEATGGVEIFVLEGEIKDSNEVYPAGSWIRRPAGERCVFVSDQRCLIYVKTGHLGSLMTLTEIGA